MAIPKETTLAWLQISGIIVNMHKSKQYMSSIELKATEKEKFFQKW